MKHRSILGEENFDFYDIVVIAAPMTNDQKTPIVFKGFDDSDLEFPGEYHTIYATFIQGDVNSSYFGLQGELGGILSCNLNETKISSITKLSPVDGTEDNSTVVYKIFSNQELDNSTISQIFSKVSLR